jgi:hypothetical protein
MTQRADPLPLCGPPGFAYETTGPWFVCHKLEDDKAQAWVLWTLDSAVLRFWLHDKSTHRKVMVDGYGITVLGTEGNDHHLSMVGTEQTCEATLRLVTEGTDMGHAVEVLRMIETLREHDGMAQM